jgi:pyridoxamine 5'-phosphate oxidase-like protein
VKTRNLERNPRIALSVQDPDNPYRYVQVRGRVSEVTEQGADATSTPWPRSTSGRTATPTDGRARCG